MWPSSPFMHTVALYAILTIFSQSSTHMITFFLARGDFICKDEDYKGEGKTARDRNSAFLCTYKYMSVVKQTDMNSSFASQTFYLSILGLSDFPSIHQVFYIQYYPFCRPCF